MGVALASLGGLAIAAACGLEDGGVLVEPIESGVDDHTLLPDTTPLPDTSPPPMDVQQPDTSPPPSCADAGGCLPEFGVGWTPYLHLVGDAGCPAIDGSTRADYVDLGKIVFDNNACVCGNCVTDAGTCTVPTLNIGTNKTCDDLVDAGTLVSADASCNDLGYNVSAGNLSISVSTQAQNTSCTIAQTGNQKWDAGTDSICSAACGFDFCGAPSNKYERCALALGVHACPNGYKQYLIDRPNSPANCTGCTCTPGATCGGSLTMFNSADCTGAAATTTVANQGCVDAGGTNIRSGIFDASAVSTTCKAGSSTPSVTPTNGELTLCCK